MHLHIQYTVYVYTYAFSSRISCAMLAHELSLYCIRIYTRIYVCMYTCACIRMHIVPELAVLYSPTSFGPRITRTGNPKIAQYSNRCLRQFCSFF